MPNEFVRSSELAGVIIQASAAEIGRASYKPWRMDADGELWFRRTPTLPDLEAVDEDEVDEEDEDDDEGSDFLD